MDRFKSILPPLALTVALALTIGLMATAYTSNRVTVSFGDFGGEFEGLAIELEYYAENEDLGARFVLSEGESQTLSPIFDPGTDITWIAANRTFDRFVTGSTFVSGLDGYGFELERVASLPDDYRLGSEGLESAPEGRFYCNYGENVSFTVDRVKVRYALVRFHDHQFPLGESRVVEVDDFKVILRPKHLYTDENRRHSFVFSENPDDYYFAEDEYTSFFDNIRFSEEEVGDAFVEPTESGFDCYHLDRTDGSIWLTVFENYEFVSTKKLGAIDTDCELLSISGEDGVAMLATYKGGKLRLNLADGVLSPTVEYSIGREEIGTVQAKTADGAVVFRIGDYKTRIDKRESNITHYLAIDKHGKLIAKGECELPETDFGNRYNPISHLDFDVRRVGDEFVILDNRCYYSTFWYEDLSEEYRKSIPPTLEEYGCGYPGKIITLLKIGAGGLVGEPIQPISADFSAKGRIVIHTSFAD